MELGIIIAVVLVLGFGVFLYKKSKEDKKQRMDSGLVYFKEKNEDADERGQQIISTVGTREGVVGSDSNRKSKN